jgi:hypothetical protein
MRLIYPEYFLKYALAVICVFYVSPALSKYVTPPTFQVVTSLNSFDGRNVSSWSGGGGPWRLIANDSNHPFANRKMGGGERDKIRGSQTFGSGYPYGADNSSTIAGRPFPYGVWPIYWKDNFRGSDEYGSDLDGVRPGGPLVLQTVTSTKQYYADLVDDETYHILTDRDTALAMMTSLATGCHVTPAWPTIFDPATSSIKLENVIQYYRASSFAVASLNYTNSLASTSTADDSDPLPDFIKKSELWKCVDNVIGDGVPIMDREPKKRKNIGVILGIVLGIFGIPALCCMGLLISALYKCCRR